MKNWTVETLQMNLDSIDVTELQVRQIFQPIHEGAFVLANHHALAQLLFCQLRPNKLLTAEFCDLREVGQKCPRDSFARIWAQVLWKSSSP